MRGRYLAVSIGIALTMSLAAYAGHAHSHPSVGPSPCPPSGSSAAPLAQAHEIANVSDGINNATNPFKQFKCIGCHSGDDSDGGEMHFDDPAALKAFLAQNPNVIQKIKDRISRTDHKRMPKPPKPALTADQQQQIITYLDQLTH